MIDVCAGGDLAACLAAWGHGPIVADDTGLPKMMMDIISIITALATVGATWVAAYFGLRDRKPRVKFGVAVTGTHIVIASGRETLQAHVFFSGVGPLPAVITGVDWMYFGKKIRAAEFAMRIADGYMQEDFPLLVEYGKSHRYSFSSKALRDLTTVEYGPNWLPPKVGWRWQLALGLRIKASTITGEQFIAPLPQMVVDFLWEGIQEYRKINPRGAK